MKDYMANETIVTGQIKIVEVPYQVNVPVYVKQEVPEYVLVKEEIIYKVPKIEYKEKTYEKPVIVEKECILPKYVEKTYEIPKYVEKVYEIPKYVEKIIEVPRIKEREELNVIKKDVTVTNAVITDKNVINAIIKDRVVEALHPRYICSKCKKEEVSP